MVFPKSWLIIVQNIILSTWSYTILSITFDINGEREIGLKFSGLVLDPFLYNGFNLAILQSHGKSPEEMQILHIFAAGFVRIFAPSFKWFIPFIPLYNLYH